MDVIESAFERTIQRLHKAIALKSIYGRTRVLTSMYIDSPAVHVRFMDVSCCVTKRPDDETMWTLRR